MRGADIRQPALFITRTVEDFVPANHPLRAIRKLIDEALRDLDVHCRSTCQIEKKRMLIQGKYEAIGINGPVLSAVR